MRIWDCLFYQGEKVLFCVALTLIRINQDDICDCTDLSEAWVILKVFSLIQDVPKMIINADELMAQCFAKPNNEASVFSWVSSIFQPPVKVAPAIGALMTSPTSFFLHQESEASNSAPPPSPKEGAQNGHITTKKIQKYRATIFDQEARKASINSTATQSPN